MAKVDVILTYFNTDVLIDMAIEKLLATSYHDFEIWIVDNSHKSRSVLINKFPDKRIHVINGAPAPMEESGYKRGRHHPDGIEVGLAHTHSDYVALFHCDSWPLKSNWIQDCLRLQKENNVELIGLQHESSIHHSFHFFKRSILKKYNYHYNVKKRQFKHGVNSLVRHPEVFNKRRHKWDWGEDLAIRIYENKNKTLGFLPVHASVLSDNTDFGEKTKWDIVRAHCQGIVYGDFVFHSWKSYKNNKKRQKYIDRYHSGEYLKEGYKPMKPNSNFIINNGIHENECYLTNILSR